MRIPLSLRSDEHAPQELSVDLPAAYVGAIVFADIESLFIALGGSVEEREGSRVKITLNGVAWRAHRSHPGKEAKKYQVEEARELLERMGVTP